MNFLKAILIVGAGGFLFGGGYSLVHQAVVMRNSLALGLLLGVGTLCLILIGVFVAMGIQFVQAKIQMAQHMANAMENDQLMARMQQSQAQTLAKQSQTVGHLTKNAGLLDKILGPPSSNTKEDSIEDLLTFDHDISSNGLG